jgi:hypothetical protein
LGAVLALTWATSTGFFDVARRELEVRRQQLVLDTTRLEDEKRRQERELSAVAARLEALDVPLLVRDGVPEAPWYNSGARVPSFIFHVEGFNLGAEPLTVHVQLGVSCVDSTEFVVDRAIAYERNPDHGHRNLYPEISDDDLRQRLGDALRRLLSGRPDIVEHCELVANLAVTRADGKKSNVRWVRVPDCDPGVGPGDRQRECRARGYGGIKWALGEEVAGD